MFFVVTMFYIHEEIGNVGVSIKDSVCSCLFDLKQRCCALVLVYKVDIRTINSVGFMRSSCM